MGFNLNFLKGVERQINPFDNGKTYKDEQGSSGRSNDAGSKAFHFIQKPVVGVGRTIENTVKYGPEVFAKKAVPTVVKGVRDIGVSSARSILRVPANVVTSLQQKGQDQAVGAVNTTLDQLQNMDYTARQAAIKKSAGLQLVLKNRGFNIDDPSDNEIAKTRKSFKPKPVTYTPGTKVEKLALGTEPVQSYQERYQGNKKVLEGSRFRSAAAPLAFLGTAATVGTDLTPAGGERKAGEQFFKRLIKADTPDAVKKVLGTKVSPEIIDRIAPAIAQTKDRNVIRNMLKEATAPPRSPEPPMLLPPSVEGGVHPAGQGSFNTDLTVPKLSTQDVPKISSTQTPQPVVAAPVPNPQQVVLDALNGKPAAKGQSPVKSVRTLAQEQKTGLSQERGQRFAAAQNASEGLSGTAAHIAELKQLGGKYKKVEWNGLKDQLGGPQQAEDVYSQLRQQIKSNKALSYTDGLNTDIALRKLILGEGLPTAGDIKRLEAVFGQDAIQQISRHVGTFQKAQEFGKQLLGVPRAIMASGDVSFGGRQALAYATAHPVEFAKQWAKQFKYFKEGLKSDDAVALTKAYKEIQNHPDFQLAKDAGLAITDFVGHSPSAREEQFIAGNLAEKIPGIGRLVRGSDHAFTGLANNIRANSFYSLVEQARQAGYTVDQKFAKEIARVVNNGTGRGSAKALEEHMGTLSTALFAPRLILSRLNTLFNPMYYIKTNPVARKEALRQLAGLAAFATGVLGTAKAAGLNVNLDPTNSDFGKVKIGDTRLDFFGGYTQYIRLMAQMAEGKTTSSLTGKESKLGTGYGDKSRKDILYSFLENKENPVVSFVTGLVKGTDLAGNPTTTPEGVKNGIIDRMVPLLAQDLNDLRTHSKSNQNVGLDVAAPLLGASGVGIQTYGQQDIKLSGKNKDYVDKLKKSGAPPDKVDAATEFFQISKTGPDRTKYAEKIKTALTAGDQQKAIELAKQYNDEYASLFKEWSAKYGKYRNDKALVKEYTSNRITGNSIARWYGAIKNPQ